MYLSITDVYGFDSQTILSMINYTNNPMSMEGFGCDGNCQEDFISATLIAEDSYGDGWNGNNLSIMIDGVLLTQKTLSSGYYGEFDLCIPTNDNMCVEIIVEEGGWPEEVSWSIIDNNNNELISGESPFYGELYDNCPIYGCIDPTAINYNPDANTDDGTCCFGEFYTVEMLDSYGDGWNGNILMIGTHELELDEGYENVEVICLENNEECFNVICDGGSWQTEVSWIIYNSQGILILSGGAPYSNCFLEGCTDPIACNYNIEATNDNGSCEYPDENGDCESVGVEEMSNNLKNRIRITDIIGREIDVIKSGQIYLKYYTNGQTEKKINFKEIY